MANFLLLFTLCQVCRQFLSKFNITCQECMLCCCFCCILCVF